MSWKAVMSHSSTSRLEPRFSAAMNCSRFSCFMPGVLKISRSLCHDCLSCGRDAAQPHAAPSAADHHPHPIPTPQLSTCRGGRQKPWTERGPGAEAKNDP